MSFLKDFDHLRIQLKDVLSATNNFNSANVIGRGGFGNVYKGEISSPEGQITVAFKQLDHRLGQGRREFWKEIMMLSKYKHENLITLMHFCIDGDQMILVYEYASRGSLDRYLADSSTLTWIQRLKISVGAARGLEFLHDPKKTQQRLIHRDIKSGNILLDEKWTVKVSDFGLSKVAPANQKHTYLVSDAVGTPGYADPLYIKTGCLTKESDVYSFGVVLFEILCGRLCYQYHEGKRTILVPEWRRCYEENRLDEIILPGLKEEMDGGSLRSFSAIAYQCLKKHREDRPSMAQILLELEYSLEQQELLENHRKRVNFLESMKQKNNRASQASFDDYKLPPEMHQSPDNDQGLNFKSRVNNKFQDWADDNNSQSPPVSDEDDSPENLVRVKQAVQVLVEVLSTGLEKEQYAAIGALVRLLSDNPLGALVVADFEMSLVDILCGILSSNCSIDIKGNTATLCCLLFGNTTLRSTIAVARCVEPLISLLVSKSSPAQLSAVRALETLVDDEKLAKLVNAYGAIIPLVRLICGRNYMLHKASSRVLVKLGKDRPSCKMEMVKAGVIEGTLDILHEAPRFFYGAFAELLEVLTCDATVAKGPSAAKVVEPLLLLLTKPEIGPESQRSALQVLVNILENPQSRADCTLSSQQAIEPFIPLLDSPALAVQQLSAELLSHLLLEEHYKKDPISLQVIGPLMRVLGSGIPILQQRALKALNNLVVTWPNEIAKAGGIDKLSKVILLADTSLALWKDAISILTSILPFSSEFSPEVPLASLVQLLGLGSDAIVISTLNALSVLGSDGSISVVAMAKSGIIEALLHLLRCHRCEESAARLLKFILTNYKIRETNTAKHAILPLSYYLLDTNTKYQQSILLATKALADLFQNETLTRAAHAGSACRAFVNVLKDQPSEEMKLVAICALKNLVRCSASNTTVVAEGGGFQVILDLIGSSDTNTSVHVAVLIELLFSTNTLQAYASSQTVRAITAAIEKDLAATGSVHDEYLKALNTLLKNFPQLRAAEPVTLSIPHLVTSLKTGSKATQEASLDALIHLSEAWSKCPVHVSRSQSNAAADVIPLLQYLIQSKVVEIQRSAMQVLVKILEHSQCRADYTLSSQQAIEPLIPLLDSPAPAVQQLSAELLSHLLLEEHYKKDPISQQVIGPLMRLLGSDIPILQQSAVKALNNLAATWPNEIAKDGGIDMLSKVILLADTSPALWNDTISILTSILPFSSEYSPEVPLASLVQLLGSGSDAIVISALNALSILGSDGSISVVTMVESGIFEALLHLLRCHRCEESAARLLKFVLSNYKIRETNTAKHAILPLSDYLLCTKTQAQAKLLVTKALGDLFQNETLTRAAHAGSACRAFVNVLKDQPSEEMKLVVICALKNLVSYSGSNTTVVAEAGGFQVILDLIGTSDTNTSVHVAMLIELLFSTNTLQAYASSQTLRAITSVIEKDLAATGTVHDEYLKVLNTLLKNFPRLRAAEPVTLSIPHLVTSLKTGSVATQEASLDALIHLSESEAWSGCPVHEPECQSNVAADAIPLLQYLIQSGQPRLKQKAELLLLRLPGTLSVAIKRGINMKPPWGTYSYYCKLKLGNTTVRQTKLAPDPDPQWYERFDWHFESPPKGQKLAIYCTMTGKLYRFKINKLTLPWGYVTIPIDRIVMRGVEAGEYNIEREGATASDTSKNLEIEFRWTKVKAPQGLWD